MEVQMLAQSFKHAKLFIECPFEPAQTVEQYTTRLKGIAQHISNHRDVEALCRELPGRMQDVVDKEGGRINK